MIKYGPLFAEPGNLSFLRVWLHHSPVEEGVILVFDRIQGRLQLLVRHIREVLDAIGLRARGADAPPRVPFARRKVTRKAPIFRSLEAPGRRHTHHDVGLHYEGGGVRKKENPNTAVRFAELN